MIFIKYISVRLCRLFHTFVLMQVPFPPLFFPLLTHQLSIETLQHWDGWQPPQPNLKPKTAAKERAGGGFHQLNKLGEKTPQTEQAKHWHGSILEREHHWFFLNLGIFFFHPDPLHLFVQTLGYCKLFLTAPSPPSRGSAIGLTRCIKAYIKK